MIARNSRRKSGTRWALISILSSSLQTILIQIRGTSERVLDLSTSNRNIRIFSIYMESHIGSKHRFRRIKQSAMKNSDKLFG
jgi:hypothetical protein